MTVLKAKLLQVCQSRFNCFVSLNSAQKHYKILVRPAFPEEHSWEWLLSVPSQLRLALAASHPTAPCPPSRSRFRVLCQTAPLKEATGNSEAVQWLAAAQYSLHFLCTISVSFHSNHCAIWRNTELCYSDLESDLWVPLILLHEQ